MYFSIMSNTIIWILRKTIYVYVCINYYDRMWIDIFHWIEKFPRYDMEKAHIQSTMNRII